MHDSSSRPDAANVPTGPGRHGRRAVRDHDGGPTSRSCQCACGDRVDALSPVDDEGHAPEALPGPAVARRDDGVRMTSGDLLGGRLRELAAVLDGRDRMMGLASRLLVQVAHADGLHDRLGGMTLQVWLEHVCRLPGPDARALLGAIDVLARLPCVLEALADGWLSWLQVAAISRAARRVRIGLLPDLDDFVGNAMVEMARFEPDAIVADVWHWVDDRQPSRLEREERARERGEFLALQPMLTGGGSIFGELGPTSFGIVAEAVATDALPPTANHPLDPDDLDDAELDGLYATLDDQTRMHTRDHGAAMAARLVELCACDLAVRDPDGATPVRRADLDHITEWPDGATDVTNLHPVGRRWHNHKTSKAWTVTREDDGATTWRHRRHGWVLRLAPPRRARAQPP